MVINIVDFDKMGAKSGILFTYNVIDAIDSQHDELEVYERPVMTTTAHFLLALREGFTIQNKGKMYTVIDHPVLDVAKDTWTIYVVAAKKADKPTKKSSSKGRKPKR